MNREELNGLPLPSQLLEAISRGEWHATSKNWQKVFPADEVVAPALYSFSLMQQVNSTWKRETRPEFVGVADGKAVPGCLNPALSLLVGELQGDAPIALDYREKGRGPSIAFLNAHGSWVVVAESFDAFWRQLHG